MRGTRCSAACLSWLLLAGAGTPAAAAPKAPAPTPAPTASMKDPATGMEFVRVEGGCFRMGAYHADEAAGSDEKPTHEVCVDGFWIGKYEVTQEQWRALMPDNPSAFDDPKRPLENAPRATIEAFIARLREAGGKPYRLPTEAEWEFAARGGVKARGTLFAGSNAMDDVAVFKDNSGRRTAPVGSKKPNELGIFDMSGNVWEWCADRYDPAYYEHSPRQNPKGPEQGDLYVIRGGSWARGGEFLRVSARGGMRPEGAGSVNGSIGFRVAVDR